MGSGADNFTTFLTTFSKEMRGAPDAPAIGRPNAVYIAPAIDLPNARAAGAPADEAPKDAVLKKLIAGGGSASISELLGDVVSSFDVLSGVLQTLSSFGMVTLEGSAVALTAEGRKAAVKLG